MRLSRSTAPILVAVALGAALIALLMHSTESTAIVGDHRTPELPPGSPPTRLISDERLAPAAQASMDPPPESVTAPTLDVDTIELDSSRHAVTWSGRLRTRSGGALPSWEVSLKSASEHFEVKVNPDGRFRWRLRSGRYAVSVIDRYTVFGLELPSAPGSGTGASATEAYVPAGRDLAADIVVVAGRVSGRVIGSRHPAADVRVELRGSTTSGAFGVVEEHAPIQPWYAMRDDGSFGPVVLPPGEYRAAYVEWVDVEQNPTLASTPMLDTKGAPVVIHVVDGAEITELELRVAAPIGR